jgi:hypothetical protein
MAFFGYAYAPRSRSLTSAAGSAPRQHGRAPGTRRSPACGAKCQDHVSFQDRHSATPRQ